jgi:hypothetical protein
MTGKRFGPAKMHILTDPGEIIAQSAGAGNSRRKRLARIVHGTPRDPQLTLRRRAVTLRRSKNGNSV